MNNFKIWLENEESKEILHMEIPMPQDIIILNEIFKKYHKKLYAVGGVVRDHLISHFHLEGKGDGPKAEKIDISCGDFTEGDYLNESDGASYWRITEGRKPMPSYKEKLSDHERWAVVAYIRTLGKGK